MEDKEIYEGEYDGIIMSIPTHAIELTIHVTTYDNGNMQKYSTTYNVDNIYEMKEEYEENCARYVITEEGCKYLEEMEAKR